MYSKQLQLLLLGIVLIVAVEYAEAILVTNVQWDEYKTLFVKTYPSTRAENVARYNFAYNKAFIDKHNRYADRGVYTYRLKPTQFSDLRFLDFSSKFPKTTWTQPLTNVILPVVATTPPTAHDILVDGGVTTNVEDQGTVCNSGWAYATAKSVEILNAITTETPLGKTLSAQSLIDCAGGGKGCTSQMPYAAFEFLAAHQQDLYLVADYENQNTQADQGMCIRPSTAPETAVKVAQYARIPDNRDDQLQQQVASNIPVVVEFDPTSFQFMHYDTGVFQQPQTRGGSHYMTVVGYGRNDALNLNYWKLLNSFGETWGDNGYFYVLRSGAKSVAKSAVLPMA